MRNYKRGLQFLWAFIAIGAASAQAELSCGTIPKNVLKVFERAYLHHKVMEPDARDLNHLYALRLSYGYMESHLYALSSNDETSELNGLEVSQDLMRVDNGRSLSGNRRATLASYREIFDGRGNYTLRVGGFPTNKGYRLKNGGEWERGDVVARFGVHHSTDFGFLQMSPDQVGRMSGVLYWVVQQSRASLAGAGAAVDFCDATLIYKDRKKALSKEFFRLANSCSPFTGGTDGHLCFGRWVSLCPRYSVLLGVTASPRYFASTTQAKAQELCLDSFR